MTKTINTALVSAFMMLLSLSVAAQDLPYSDFFTGTFNFEVEYKGPAANFLKENEPNNKLQMHITDGSYIVNLMGGRHPKTFIFVPDSNFTYSMDVATKRAFRRSAHTDVARGKKLPKAEFTGKTVTLEGIGVQTGDTKVKQDIECQIYKCEKEDGLFYFYVNEDYRTNRSLYRTKRGAQASFLISGLDGMIPLKTVKKTKDLTVTTYVKSIKAKEFNPIQFTIPPDFTVHKRDYRF